MMKVEFLPRFIKDLKALKSSSSYAEIKRVAFEEIPSKESLSDLKNVKKLKAFDTAYRLRVGDYRIGFFWDDETVIFSRVLHRSKIYKYFP
ncbi:MAG: type II toxin-antitoxin system RelE/ParE family toxin [Cyanobacteria bacterium J06588_5]